MVNLRQTCTFIANAREILKKMILPIRVLEPLSDSHCYGNSYPYQIGTFAPYFVSDLIAINFRAQRRLYDSTAIAP